MGAKKLDTHFVHLGRGATAEAQPAFTGVDWYDGYGERAGGDGAEGRLVALHTFTEPWDSWEAHPEGEEVVVCTAGEITLIQELDGAEQRIRLKAGEYAINPRGVWHTADVEGEATVLFITAGMGTDHRPRHA
ncbi:MAG: cupin domain-containing protein [Pseudomonadota bacterium]